METIVHKRQWMREKIAALSDWQLAQLNYDELVEIVIQSGVPLRNCARVREMESDSLVRLVYWARQCCRSQLN